MSNVEAGRAMWRDAHPRRTEQGDEHGTGDRPRRRRSLADFKHRTERGTKSASEDVDTPAPAA